MSTTPRRLANDDKPTPPPRTQSKPSNAQAEATSPKLSADDIAAAQLAQLVSDLKGLDPDAEAMAQRKGDRGIPYATDFNMETDEHFAMEEDDRRKIAAGFWAEGEESMGPDEDYYGDDLTSLGHAELRQHRQLREYARLVAWELPLLSRELPMPQSTTQHGILIYDRTCPTLHPSNRDNPLPLPLHLLPRRIAPRHQQNRRRILPPRPRSPHPRRQQTHQTRGAPLQSHFQTHQALVREIRHPGPEQALRRRDDQCLGRRGQGPDGQL
jgi:hypothetical protein